MRLWFVIASGRGTTARFFRAFRAAPACPVDSLSGTSGGVKSPNPGKSINCLQTTPVYLTIEIHPVFLARQRFPFDGYSCTVFAIFALPISVK